MDPADFEREIEREIDEVLRRAPAPQAPRTLRPAVMAVVRARRARPWYERTWSSWPLVGQLAAVSVAIMVVGACVIGAPSVSGAATTAGDHLIRMASGMLPWDTSPSVRPGLDWFYAARLLWRTVIGPATFYATVFAVAVGGALALCVAALAGLTLGRTA